MGRKIFVSYKYADDDVFPAVNPLTGAQMRTTVRNYVGALEYYLDGTDDIYKGEHDDEDLSDYDENTIWEKLKDRIFDSTLTILMISPNMKEKHRRDASQWIPWEIFYSLRRTSRNGRRSEPNAILSLVLPDRNGSYSYYLKEKTCGGCSCVMHNDDVTFGIVKRNMFNRKHPQAQSCANGVVLHRGEPSYIKVVKWEDFAKDPQSHIDAAAQIMENIGDYNISVEV